MTHYIDKDALVAEIQRLQDLTMDENKNFYSEAAEGEYNALCNIEHFIDSLQEESISENLEDFALQYAGHHAPYDDCMQEVIDAVKAGAKWQENHLWKPADGDDLKDKT
jgi:hypothetical protein